MAFIGANLNCNYFGCAGRKTSCHWFDFFSNVNNYFSIHCQMCLFGFIKPNKAWAVKSKQLKVPICYCWSTGSQSCFSTRFGRFLFLTGKTYPDSKSNCWSVKYGIYGNFLMIIFSETAAWSAIWRKLSSAMGKSANSSKLPRNN